MKKENSREFKQKAKAGKIGKLNMHSVFKQNEITFPCPHCNKLVRMSIEINERSSAVYLNPTKVRDSSF